MFESEMALLQRLTAHNHPNVVRCFGASVEPDIILLVMELLSNGNLLQALKRDRIQAARSGKPRSLSWYHHGRQVAIDVARGLAFMHSLNIAHRLAIPVGPKN